MPNINGKEYDLINGQLVENQAPNYVQENAMANNVTNKATNGWVSSLQGQVSPDQQKQLSTNYNFGGRNIDMSGDPVTLQTTDLSRIQELQTMQRTPEQEQEFDKLKFKVAGANVNAQQQPITPSRSYEIQKNLEEGYKNAPQLFSNRETFNQAYEYNNKPIAEKQAIDTFWNAKQSDTNTAFNNLKAGISVPKDSPAYTQAQSRLANLNKYKLYTPTQLAQSIKSGDILPWTQEYNDLLSEAPSLLSSAQKINEIKPVSNVELQAQNQINKIATETGIGKYLSDGTITADEMNEITNSSEIDAKQNNLSTVTTKRQELQKEYEDIENTVDKEHPNSSSSYRSKLIANEQRKKLPALKFAISQEESLAGEIASMKKDKAELFSTNLALYKDRAEKDYEAQKLQEARTYAENKAKQDLLMKEGDINSTDPYIKQKAVQNAVDRVLETYKDIPMARSREQMVADITNAVNAGQELGQAISQNIITPIQNKPEFKAKLAEEKAKGIKYQEIGGKLYKVENGVLTDTGISTIEPPKSSFETIGKDAEGNDIKGFVNPATQTVTPYGKTGNLQGAELMKAIASGNVNGKKFFGVYATGDPTWQNRANLYTQFSNMELEDIIAKYKNSPVKAEEIRKASEQYGVDPIMIATILAADSSMGTNWYGKARGLPQNYNYGNVGQTDEKSKKGIAVNMPNSQEWVNAVANNLKKRLDAMQSVVGTTPTAKEENVEYSKAQKNVMDKVESITEANVKALKAVDLDVTDWANYLASSGKASQKQIDNINKERASFDKLPQASDWNAAQGVQEWLSSTGNTDLSGPAIQGLISNYAKILDPTSVVRESEYAMAQKGASQGAIDQTKQQIATFVAGGSNVLSKEAQAVLKEAMQNRLNAMKTAYLNLAKTRVKQAIATGVPITLEQLTGEPETPTTKTKESALDIFRRKFKGNQ